MPLNPSISIIICTKNRAAGLLRTLESLDSCRIPAGWRVQLIVVDNASTDATARIINETRLSRMSAQYVYEPKTGLSNARNTGLKHAEGDVILFTDDDVLVEETWIQELAGPIIEDRCDAAVGLVMLSTRLMRPWMTRTHKGWLASSLEAQIPHWPVSLVGANMGFSSSVLRQVPAFDPELGAGGLGSGEDTLFGLQLVEAGYRIEFNNAARVVHDFDRSRLQRRNLIEYAVKRGRSEAYIDYHWKHKPVLNLSREFASYWIRLKIRRMVQHPGPLYAEGCPPWEMSYVSNLARCRQFRREAMRTRVYGYHALVRRDLVWEGGTPVVQAQA